MKITGYTQLQNFIASFKTVESAVSKLDVYLEERYILGDYFTGGQLIFCPIEISAKKIKCQKTLVSRSQFVVRL